MADTLISKETPQNASGGAASASFPGTISGRAAPGPLAERDRHPFVTLRNEFDRLFDEAGSMLRNPWASWSRRSPFDLEPLLRTEGAMDAIIPAAEVEERDGDYRVALEMPGLEDKDVEVAVRGDVLTVRAEKREETHGPETGDKSRCVSERRYGMCARSFQLPANVDVEAIAASLKNGVLTVTLPKTGPARPDARRIAITTG